MCLAYAEPMSGDSSEDAAGFVDMTCRGAEALAVGHDEVDGLDLEAGVWFGEMGLSLLIVVLIIYTQLEVGPR